MVCSVLKNGETSVRAAIATNGWPGVSKLKGCAMFFLNIYGPKARLQREASGKCFFPRGWDISADDEDCVYFEMGSNWFIPAAAQLQARNAVARGFYSNASEMRANVDAGLGLVSTDTPTQLDCDSVFLRSSADASKSDSKSIAVTDRVDMV